VIEKDTMMKDVTTFFLKLYNKEHTGDVRDQFPVGTNITIRDAKGDIVHQFRVVAHDEQWTIPYVAPNYLEWPGVLDGGFRTSLNVVAAWCERCFKDGRRVGPFLPEGITFTVDEPLVVRAADYKDWGYSGYTLKWVSPDALPEGGSFPLVQVWIDKGQRDSHKRPPFSLPYRD
jgi:hypothetical protein